MNNPHDDAPAPSGQPAPAKRRSRWRRALGAVRIGACGIGGVLGVVFAIGSWAFAVPAWDGAVTDHFDGDVFINEEPAPTGFGRFLKWQMNRELGPWDTALDTPAGDAPPERVTGGRLRVTFVNHSTVLIQMDGVNVLTDPIWSERPSPVSWAGPERHAPPGIRFEDLPPIDVVLISHNHYDHMDLPTLRRLVEAHAPRILVPLNNEAFLASEGITGAEDLDWWESTEVGEGFEAVCVPVRHFSGRSLFDRNRALWSGWALRGPSGKVYFGGDTGWGKHFAQARERLGAFRLALLPIGSYRPRWFMNPVHIDPQDAVRAQKALGAATALGVHFGCFTMGDDAGTEPIEELQKALDAAGDPRPRFWTLKNGEGRDVPRGD